MPKKTGRGEHKNHGEHNAPHRTKDQKILNREEMVKLLSRGWTKSAIARKFGLSMSQITYDWKLVIKEVLSGNETDKVFLLQQKLEEYSECKRELWAAYEKSRKKKVPYKDKDGNLSFREVEKTPDAGIVKMIADVIKSECTLLGLDPKRMIEMSGHINWEVLDNVKLPPGEMRDEIEEELVKALGYGDGGRETTEIITPDGESIKIDRIDGGVVPEETRITTPDQVEDIE